MKLVVLTRDGPKYADNIKKDMEHCCTHPQEMKKKLVDFTRGQNFKLQRDCVITLDEGKLPEYMIDFSQQPFADGHFSGQLICFDKNSGDYFVHRKIKFAAFRTLNAEELRNGERGTVDGDPKVDKNLDEHGHRPLTQQEIDNDRVGFKWDEGERDPHIVDVSRMKERFARNSLWYKKIMPKRWQAYSFDQLVRELPQFLGKWTNFFVVTCSIPKPQYAKLEQLYAEYEAVEIPEEADQPMDQEEEEEEKEVEQPMDTKQADLAKCHELVDQLRVSRNYKELRQELKEHRVACKSIDFSAIPSGSEDEDDVNLEAQALEALNVLSSGKASAKYFAVSIASPEPDSSVSYYVAKLKYVQGEYDSYKAAVKECAPSTPDPRDYTSVGMDERLWRSMDVVELQRLQQESHVIMIPYTEGLMEPKQPEIVSGKRKRVKEIDVVGSFGVTPSITDEQVDAFFETVGSLASTEPEKKKPTLAGDKIFNLLPLESAALAEEMDSYLEQRDQLMLE